MDRQRQRLPYLTLFQFRQNNLVSKGKSRIEELEIEGSREIRASLCFLHKLPDLADEIRFVLCAL